MVAQIRIVKIFLLISFILILFNSYSKENYLMMEASNYNFSYVVKERTPSAAQSRDAE